MYFGWFIFGSFVLSWEEGECTWDDKSACSACKLVVAPSTIPNAGLGIFTLVELQPNDLVGYGELVIPIPALPLTMDSAFEDYSWNGRIYGGDLSAFAPGLQSLTNSHLALMNIHQVKPATKLYENSVDSTPYHRLETIVDADIMNIPAGGELFTVYGDHWFEGRQRFTGLANSEDYLEAETLAKKFDQIGKASAFHGEYPWENDLWELVIDTVAVWNNRQAFLDILPQYQEVQRVTQLGIRSLYESQATRTMDELLGGKARCLDAIKPGPSKIHGMGAFATRAFRKGDTVTGSPALHSIKTYWNAKAQVWDSSTKSYKAVNETSSDQYALLINYCWSHEESSILLCPYGMGISYINHSKNPNIEIRWAPNGQLSQRADWFEKTPMELSKTKKVGLALDYVALRDIGEGEELTVGYGTAWEDAYREYQRKEGTSTDPSYYNGLEILKTESEQVDSPYPSDIELKCHPNVMKNELPMDSSEEMWKQVNAQDLFECHILERQLKEISDGSAQLLYAVRVWYQGNWRGRGGIPRNYLKWFSTAQKSAFRFPMQLPDDMVPRAWKDSYSKPFF